MRLWVKSSDNMFNIEYYNLTDKCEMYILIIKSKEYCCLWIFVLETKQGKNYTPIHE